MNACGSVPMAMNFQENVTLAMAVFTILASIYFFNKAQQ
uniref:Small integral membrane protein 47 n=1 Tax=Equus asinus TaxID=9793 RepID=A0A9L0K7T0_EQUAS